MITVMASVVERNHLSFFFKMHEAFICFRSSTEGSSNQNLIKTLYKNDRLVVTPPQAEISRLRMISSTMET